MCDCGSCEGLGTDSGKEVVTSPCCGVCELSPKWGCCIGCGRSIKEIMENYTNDN